MELNVKINKESIIPLYHQLKTIISEQIEKRYWEQDDMIPSERELSDEFDISRMTVRHAINDLVNEGVLYRKKGMGTFVAKQKINQGLTQLSHFTKDMETMGMKAGSRVIVKKVVKPSLRIAERLQIKDAEEVMELIRLRLADGEPMALEKSYLPLSKVSPLLDVTLENKSLYAALKDKCGLTLGSARQTIEVSYLNSREEAELLSVDVDTPVLKMSRVTFLESGEPIEAVESLYRADRYKFTIEMNT